MKYYIIYPEKTLEFENYKQLVNYLLKDTTPSWYTCKHRLMHETLEERIKICDSDTYRGIVSTNRKYINSLHRFVDFYDYGYIPRDVYVVDEFGNNAWNHLLLNDLKCYQYREDINLEWKKYINRNKKVKHSRWSMSLTSVKFRCDPVPMTGVHHHYNWLRNPHTTQEIRLSCDTEYKDFVRKSRGKHLPSSWDDIPVASNSDISWKRCTKNRHQWENKIKCHNKHVDVYTPVDLIEEIDLD